jgi:trehalose 6-phosphate phosphatase
MSQKSAIRKDERWAVFLDVDGTLLELAETPQSVCVPEGLKQLLSQLAVRLDGALALVSGRTIADLDRLFAPFYCSAVGVHGCEIREPAGCVVRPGLRPEALDEARRELRRLVTEIPQLLLEDKHWALALHYRRAPQLRMFVHAHMSKLLAAIGTGFRLQQGKEVFEICPAACSKGAAIAQLLEQSGFEGRTPVFIGDDLTDEDAFAYLNARSGLSIVVGDRAATVARHRLRNVNAVRDWLGRIPLLDPRSLAFGMSGDHFAVEIEECDMLTPSVGVVRPDGGQP